MSATKARQGGWVQLEQSNMCLSLNMAKMATGGFSCAVIAESKELMKQHRNKVQEAKKRGVQFPGHNKVTPAIERNPAMFHENHTYGCLSYHNGTAQNPQTRWRCKWTGPPPAEPAAPQPLMPPPPGMSPVPPGDRDDTDSYEIDGMPSRCVYIHSPLPNTQFFNHNPYAKDSKHNKDFIPDLLSTQSAVWQCRWHWFWRWE